MIFDIVHVIDVCLLCRLCQNYLNHPQQWQFCLTTRSKTDSKTFTLVSVPQTQLSVSYILYIHVCTIYMCITYIYHVADDQSRVCLTEIPGVEGSNYINASFIDVCIYISLQHIALHSTARY